MLLGGVVLIFLLVQATNNRLLYERYYTRLLWVNIAAAAVLALVILWGVYRLLSRLRRGKFGSRLLIKLAAIFGLVGVLPGLLIYVVSYQFVSRSIESWFDVKVEGALDAGLSLGRATLDTLASDCAAGGVRAPATAVGIMATGSTRSHRDCIGRGNRMDEDGSEDSGGVGDRRGRGKRRAVLATVPRTADCEETAGG